MVATYVAALVLSWIVARLGVQPASILVPGVAAFVVALLFASWPEEGLGVFLLFSLLAITWQQLFQADLRYFDELGLVFLAAAALITRRIVWERLRPGVLETSAVVFALAGVASSLASGTPFLIWLPGLLLVSKGMVFFFLVAWMPLRRDRIGEAGSVVIGASVALLALGLLEFVDPAAFQRALGLPSFVQVRGGIAVIKSLFLHPAVFGWLMVFSSLFLFVRFLVLRSWWALPLAALLDVGAVLSGRRTPLLGLGLALIVGVIWYISRVGGPRALVRSWVPIVAALAVVAVVFAPALGRFYVDTTAEYVGSPAAIAEIFAPHPDARVISTLAPRVALYTASVAIARDHFPLGAGFGRFGSSISRENYSPIYRQYGLDRIYGLGPTYPVAAVDTFWPAILGETGPIGLLAIATFLLTLFVLLWRASTRGLWDTWQIVTIGAVLITTQAAVASLTAGTFVAPPLSLFVFGTAAMVLACTDEPPPSAGGHPLDLVSDEQPGEAEI